MTKLTQNTTRPSLSDRAAPYLQLKVLLAMTATMLLVCFLFFVFADKPVALFWNEALSTPAYNLWRDITKIGQSEFYFFVSLTLFFGGRALMLWSAPLGIARWYGQLARIGLFAFACFALSGLFVHLLKRLFGRVRPKHFLSREEYGFSPFNPDWTYNSFPSGHAQTIFVAATLCTLFWPRYWWAFLSFACVIAFSRVIVNAHFLSDIVMGSFIAVLSVLLIKRRWFDDIDRVSYRPSHYAPSHSKKAAP